MNIFTEIEALPGLINVIQNSELNEINSICRLCTLTHRVCSTDPLVKKIISSKKIEIFISQIVSEEININFALSTFICGEQVENLEYLIDELISKYEFPRETYIHALYPCFYLTKIFEKLRSKCVLTKDEFLDIFRTSIVKKCYDKFDYLMNIWNTEFSTDNKEILDLIRGTMDDCAIRTKVDKKSCVTLIFINEVDQSEYRKNIPFQFMMMFTRLDLRLTNEIQILEPCSIEMMDYICNTIMTKGIKKYNAKIKFDNVSNVRYRKKTGIEEKKVFDVRYSHNGDDYSIPHITEVFTSISDYITFTKISERLKLNFNHIEY